MTMYSEDWQGNLIDLTLPCGHSGIEEVILDATVITVACGLSPEGELDYENEDGIIEQEITSEWADHIYRCAICARTVADSIDALYELLEAEDG